MLQRTLFASAMLTMLAKGISLEDLFAHKSTQIESSTSSQITSQIASQISSENGTIRIPITKQQTNLAQSGAQRLKITGDATDELFANVQSDIVRTEASQIASSDHGKVAVVEPVYNDSNMSYTGELFIGSGENPQKIRCIFDTGSANPWVLSKQGTRDMDPEDDAWYFDPQLSPSFEEPYDEDKERVSISFGTGSINGYFVQDQVILGDPKDPENQLLVPDWKFGMVTSHENMFDGKFDALIGMAYPEFAEPGAETFFDGLMRTGQLQKNVHSWYLSYNPDVQSEILFGNWDEDKFTGQIQWHDVRNKLFYSLQLDDILIGGVSTGYCTKEGVNCLVAPDSGTSLNTFSAGHNEVFQQKYGAAVDCTEDELLQFPDITYVIDGVDYVLPSHHWMSRTHDKSNPMGGSCKTFIDALSVEQPELQDLHIAGDAFMQIYYTIHDRDNDRVGFALAKHEKPEVLVQYDKKWHIAAVKMIEDDHKN